MADREGRGLEARMDLELREDTLDVGTDGVSTNPQFLGDLQSSGSANEEAEYLTFAPR